MRQNKAPVSALFGERASPKIQHNHNINAVGKYNKHRQEGLNSM
jgi:hypothetical protein